MIELSVIVPVYNEAKNVGAMADSLGQVLERHVGPGRWTFVMVDNGSSDGTGDAVVRIAKAWPTTALKLTRPDFGEALHHGLMHAQGDWAYIVNVDFWDEAMLAWCWRHRGPYDLVLGSKRLDPALNRQPATRKLLSWGLNTILRAGFGFPGTDTHGQKFLSLGSLRPIVERCRMRRGQFDTELTLRALRAGLPLAEVPVPIREFRSPRNRLFVKVRRNAVDLWRLKRVMRDVPRSGPRRLDRLTRRDLLDDAPPSRQQASTIRDTKELPA